MCIVTGLMLVKQQIIKLLRNHSLIANNYDVPPVCMTFFISSLITVIGSSKVIDTDS